MLSGSVLSFSKRLAVLFAAAATVFACASADDIDAEDEEADDGEDTYESTEADLVRSGPCAGTALDKAVRCATAKGARVLSYYRSPADQERVRRENRCRNRCTGQSGCVRPTANCTTSPHTRCAAVDFVSDGAPLSRSALKACGFVKTKAPHKNHYDLVR